MVAVNQASHLFRNSLCQLVIFFSITVGSGWGVSSSAGSFGWGLKFPITKLPAEFFEIHAYAICVTRILRTHRQKQNGQIKMTDYNFVPWFHFFPLSVSPQFFRSARPSLIFQQLQRKAILHIRRIGPNFLNFFGGHNG